MSTPFPDSNAKNTEHAIQRAIIKLAHPDWSEEQIDETLLHYKRIQENMNQQRKENIGKNGDGESLDNKH